MKKWLGRIMLSVPFMIIIGTIGYAVGPWTVALAFGLALGTAIWMIIAFKLMDS